MRTVASLKCKCISEWKPRFNYIPFIHRLCSHWWYKETSCVCESWMHMIPLSKAMRNSRFRCSSFINSSFWRKRAMRSSSRYCFSFLSCSVPPLVAALPPEAPAAADREPDWPVHWLMEETEEEDEEGWERLLCELYSLGGDRRQNGSRFIFL